MQICIFCEKQNLHSTELNPNHIITENRLAAIICWIILNILYLKFAFVRSGIFMILYCKIVCIFTIIILLF